MRSTDKFEFKTVGSYDAPAIWFRLKEKDVIVFPLELYKILWNCFEEHRIAKGIKVQFQIFPNEVFGMYFDDSCGAYQIKYNRDTFVDSAITALRELCNYVINGKGSLYQNFTITTAENLIIGLKSLRVPRNYSQIFANEICIEEFNFKFVEPYNCNTHYKLSIGDRSYESNLSDWTTDFTRIRNELEAFVLSVWTKHEINLYFEDSPTILSLKSINLYFGHFKVVQLTVLSDEFTKFPILFGWCEPRQLVRSLYLGLLELFIVETDWFDDGYNGDWNEFRLRSYNELQSCIIENFINGANESEQAFSPRNRIMHSVEEMLEDLENLKQKPIPRPTISKCSAVQVSDEERKGGQ